MGLSAAGAGRRFHSSPEFSPPECATSTTGAPAPRPLPYVTEKANEPIDPLEKSLEALLLRCIGSWHHKFRKDELSLYLLFPAAES